MDDGYPVAQVEGQLFGVEIVRMTGAIRPVGAAGGFLSELTGLSRNLTFAWAGDKGGAVTAIIRRWQSSTWPWCPPSDSTRRSRTHTADPEET